MENTLKMKVASPIYAIKNTKMFPVVSNCLSTSWVHNFTWAQSKIGYNENKFVQA